LGKKRRKVDAGKSVQKTGSEPMGKIGKLVVAAHEYKTTYPRTRQILAHALLE